MKKKLLATALLLAAFLTPGFLEARISMGESILIEGPPTEEIFAIGDEITITAKLQNEFIGIGRNIFTATDVHGDFIGIGFNVNFEGNAGEDIYLIGNTISVEGDISGSMTAFGRNIRIRTSTDGNLRASAERIRIYGNVKGKTIVWGSNIFIGGEFNDIAIYGNKIYFAPDILVHGDLTYNTPEEMDLTGLNVAGLIKWNRPFTERAKDTAPVNLLKRFYTFFSLLFPMLLMLGMFPNLFKQTAGLSGRKFIQCFGAGMVFIVLTLIALPVIFITIVGAPLGLIAASMFFSSIYLSRTFPAIFIGRTILFKMQERTSVWLLATLIGIFLFTILSINPTAKILINIISIPAGFGALFMGRTNLIKRLRKEKIL
jgi:cytoskeletal protein CcmA (bactofilin family)